MNDGNPSKIKDMINFDKLRTMANKAKDIVAKENVCYTFKKNEAIYMYLSKADIITDFETLKNMGKECEKV